MYNVQESPKQHEIQLKQILSTKIPNAEKDAIDLLSKMLLFHPNDRISVFKALQHPFLKSFETGNAPKKAPIFQGLSFSSNYTKESLKDLLYAI